MLRQNLGYKVLALLVALFLWFYVVSGQRRPRETQALTVPVVLRTRGEPAPGYRIARASVQPALVTIAGDAQRLRETIFVPTAPLDLAGARADIHGRSLALALPQGITSVSDSRVKASVVIEPQQ
jgi:YbbR domain-containing protein